MGRGFSALYERVERTPGYQAERMAVAFLAELNAQMKARGMSNSDLARAAGVSPAYITKLFRGPSNLSLETVAKLALAVNCLPHVHMAENGAQVRWFDVMQGRVEACERTSAGEAFKAEALKAMKRALEQQAPLPAGEACNDQQYLSALRFG